MNPQKRGQSLSLNTIVIAIIVIIVLVALVTFFLFGFSGLTSRIKTIFFSTTVGTDKSLAVESCRQFCDQVQTLPEALRAGSPYCTQEFKVDDDNDGRAESTYICDTRNHKSPVEGTFKSFSVPCAPVKCFG